jgi:Zn-dependent protease
VGEGGLRFSIAGFPVSVPLGGLLGVLLIAYLWAPSFAEPGQSGIALAVVFAVLLYAAVLVHEIAHAVAARAFGFDVHGITLWLLGGYTVYEHRNARPWTEFVISVAGPLSTLGIAAACWWLAGLVGPPVSTVLGALAWTNLLLGVLNLLPGAPLDGGGVVKAVVWAMTGSEGSGSRAAGYAGLVLAGLIAALAIVSMLSGSGALLLTLVLAAFIGFGAYQSLKSARVGGQMERLGPQIPRLIRPVLAVGERDSLAAALHRWDTATQVGVVTVDTSGRLLAALSPDAAGAVPAERRAEVQVGPFTAAIPAKRRAVLSDDPHTLVVALADSGEPYLYVTDAEHRPLGVLLADDVNKALAGRR